MSSTSPATSMPATSFGDDGALVERPRRSSTETKSATKTTELIAYAAAVLAVALTAMIVGDGDDGGSTSDPFSANDALRYITYLTIGYMIARGLAKSGSREPADA